MLSIYLKTSKDAILKKIKEPKTGCGMYVINPKPEEIDYLSKIGIDPTYIEDALDPDEIPRIEKEKEGIYAILNVPYEEEEKIFTVPLLFVSFKNFFLILSKARLEIVDFLFSRQELLTTQKTKIFLNLSLSIVSLYQKEIRKINKNIYNKKVKLSKLSNKDVVDLIELENVLNKFTTAMVSSIGMFEKILSGQYLPLFDEDRDLSEDLIIDSRQCLEMSKTSIRNVTNIRETYSAFITNNLNEIIKFLTSLTVIVAIPTIIASIYGMNIPLPFQKNPLALVFILAITGFISFLIYLIFYFKKWL